MTGPIGHILRLSALLLLVACTVPDNAADPYDPFEDNNRVVHGFNRGVDTVALRPAARGYGTLIPEPVRLGVGNFASNFDMPRVFMNDVLQGNLGDAANNGLRFLVNSTVGVLGLFDVAGVLGIETREADFGETLAVWGVPEGAYVELPFFGPRTERAFAGNVVDLVFNPTNFVFGPDWTLLIYGARGATVLDNRFVLGDTLDEVLYNSADSYALLRTLYLQNRRFELSERGAVGSNVASDSYEDLYGDIFDE